MSHSCYTGCLTSISNICNLQHQLSLDSLPYFYSYMYHFIVILKSKVYSELEHHININKVQLTEKKKVMKLPFMAKGIYFSP